MPRIKPGTDLDETFVRFRRKNARPRYEDPRRKSIPKYLAELRSGADNICPESGKVPFSSAAIAMEALNVLSPHRNPDDGDTYRCPSCNRWHLTRMDPTKVERCPFPPFVIRYPTEAAMESVLRRNAALLASGYKHAELSSMQCPGCGSFHAVTDRGRRKIESAVAALARRQTREQNMARIDAVRRACEDVDG